MKLIDQHTKSVMEECKKRAENKVGVSFNMDTLEYILSNQDIIELSPKIMIPTLYDYWVHDVYTYQGKGQYSIFPHNPYETVINTRPPISFYNDNNPDWLNIMIFYHVLFHIDFFQNNQFFSHTWRDDFLGKALSDKRRINRIREELGEKKRFVDYVIEFTRGVDNLVNFYADLKTEIQDTKDDSMISFYFSDFLKEKEVSSADLMKEVEKFNQYVDSYGEEDGSKWFIEKVKGIYPEFKSLYNKFKERKEKKNRDLIEFLMNESEVINKEENKWMKEVMNIVRDTSLYFQPQIRTKILNEGWATMMHNFLILQDERLSSHEVDLALVNSKVVSNPKVGINPYAIGYKILEFLYGMGEKGKINNYQYQSLLDIDKRKEFDKKLKGEGWNTLFQVRKNFNDFMLLNFLDKRDFQEFVTKNKLFVAGKKLNIRNRTWEYYIKSRNGENYRNMVIDTLYHPPKIKYNTDENGKLNLEHIFEGKQLHRDYIDNVLIGLEFLWGKPIVLKTTEFVVEDRDSYFYWLTGEIENLEYKKRKVVYSCVNYKVNRKIEHGEGVWR